ncbi:hypothetical protein H0H93_015547 [Arthromyces matolae]|nr:hypothetical protein H0H93_015547 [Arthromyces matolae]
MASMLTPSPPPTVSPHVYTWRHAPLVVPTSPLANMGNNAGPLTNASARVSLTRLNLPPTRVRIQNAAV